MPLARLRVFLVMVAMMVALGVFAAPASAHTIRYCDHNDHLYPTYFVEYLGHFNTPYGVHYHRYRHIDFTVPLGSKGRTHTTVAIC